MGSDPKHPVPGDKTIDASDLPLLDNPRGTVKNLRKLRAGYKTAVTTLVTLPAAMLSRAGIDAAQIKLLQGATGELDYAEELLPAVLKLGEMIKETAQDRRNVVAGIIEEAAAQTRRRAKDDPNKKELLGALETVTGYQSEAAQKAVKTKIKTGKLQPKGK